MKAELISKGEWVIRSWSGTMQENLDKDRRGPRLMVDVDSRGIHVKPEKEKDAKKNPPFDIPWGDLAGVYGADKIISLIVKVKGEENLLARIFTLNEKDKKAGLETAKLIEMNRCVDWYNRQDAEVKERTAFARCPSCSFPFNIGPAADSRLIMCPTCQKLLNNRDDSYPVEDGENVCPSCGVYTKLGTQTLVKEQIVTAVEQKMTACFGCLRGEALKSFLWSFLASIGIMVINWLTIKYMNRYFPVLIIFGVLVFLYSLVVLFKYLVKTAARGVAAVSELEKAGDLVRAKRFKEAEDMIFKIEQKVPASLGVSFNRALISLHMGNPGAAVSCLESGLKTCPNHGAFYALGYGILSDKKDALEDFREKYEKPMDEINCRWPQEPDRAGT